MSIPLKVVVNGVAHADSVEARTSLLTYLREVRGLLGAKRGCEEGECGSCTVLLDGQPVAACLIFAVEVEGSEIVTVEGLGRAENLSPIQRAIAEAGASQCGFCIPGVLLGAKALLAEHPRPGEEEIRRAISGNLCRCTGYDRIVAAIQQAAEGEK
ncbi:MAG: (2Fe-2S)-binding protein [bacterium]